MRRSRRLAALALAPLLAAACAPDAPLDSLDPAGPQARMIDSLFNSVLGIAALVFVLVQGGVLYLIWRFRRRADDDELPEQVHGNTRLEIGWTLVPAVILTFVAVFTVTTIVRLADRPETDLRVQVIGQQWWWEFRYDTDLDGEYDDIVTANDLVIPAGVPIDLTITSRDVIHSFWVPRLHGKMDAVPGRHHPKHFEADEPGIYWGVCAEYCGLAHAQMKLRVVALDEAGYREWVAGQTEFAEAPEPGTLAAAGLEAFRLHCTACHLVSGGNEDIYDPDAVPLVARAGPDLTHFASRGVFAGGMFDLWEDLDGDGEISPDEVGGRLNVADLEAWLRTPTALKPMAPEHGLGMPDLGLTEEIIDALVAYLKTLD